MISQSKAHEDLTTKVSELESQTREEFALLRAPKKKLPEPKVYVPMPPDERRKLFTEFEDLISPSLTKQASQTSERYAEQIRKQLV